MKIIRYMLYLLIILLTQCETTKQSNVQKNANEMLFQKFQEDMDGYSKNWKYKPIIVDYDSIEVNKSEPYGKPIFIPTLGRTSLDEIVISPDGRYVLLKPYTELTAIKLCSIDGSEIRKFKGNNGVVRSMTFSPDGKNILTGDENNLAKLWDINGNEIREFKGHSGWVTSAVFSPNGKLILTGSLDGRAILWNLNGNKIREIKEYDSGKVKSAIFSPDGKYILIGTDDGLAKLWDLNGNKIHEFEGTAKMIDFLAFSPDGKYFLTGSIGESALLRDIKGKKIKNFMEAFSFAFSPSGKFIITGNSNSTTTMWDLNGNEIKTIPVNAKNSIAFSPDGNYVLTSLDIWDTRENGKVKTLKNGNPDWVWQMPVAFSFDGKYILTGQKKTAKLTDIGRKEISILTGHSDLITSVAFSPSGKYILTGSLDKTAKLWDLNGNELRTFQEEGSDYEIVAFASDTTFATTSKGVISRITIWDIGGNKIRTLDALGHSIAISPDGAKILIGDFTGITLVDLNGKEMQTFSVNAVKLPQQPFSNDGKYLYIVNNRDGDELWEINGKKIRTFSAQSFITFSPDGKYLLTSDGLLDINGKKVWTFEEALLTSTMFADGKHLGLTGTLFTHGIFSPDGKFILTMGNDGIARYFSLDGKRWIALMATEDGKLVYTNDGRFDYTGEKMKSLVNFRKGGTNELITLDSLFDEFYTPGLLQKFFGGKGSKKPEKDLEEIIKKSPIPQVTTNTNSGESESATGTANVTVTACDKGGGAEDIRLYHNNALVDLEATRGIKINSTGKCQTKAFDVALFPGENSFRGTARNRENLWGYSDYLRLSWKPKEKTKPTQHLVVIGVNQYSGNTFSSLQYAVPDAKLFQESLLSKSKNLYGKTEVYELYNEAASRDGIRTLLKNVANKVKPENGDVLILFFAGHGVSVDNQYYFIPAKYSGDAGKSSLDAGAFPQTMLVDLVSAIHAEKKLIVLDSCQSGGSEWEGSIGRFSHASGVGIIAAAQSVQFALESSKFGHGLLTYSISDEIKNGQREKDGKLYLNILASRVKRAVEKLAAERKHKQDPYTMIKSDFELAE